MANPGGEIGGLFYIARRLLDDIDDGTNETELRWSNDDLYDYFNAGQREVCIRTLSYEKDDEEVSLVDGTYEYSIDDKIIYIKHATLNSSGNIVNKIGYEDLVGNNSWSTPTGDPIRFCERINNKILVNPTPDGSDTLNMVTIETPSTTLSDSVLVVEIDDIYHDALVEYVLWRAYEKDDSDLFDAELRKKHERRFIEMVGPQIDFVVYKAIKTQPRDIQFGLFRR